MGLVLITIIGGTPAVVSAAAPASCSSASSASVAELAQAPRGACPAVTGITRAGSWFIDSSGRVLIPHGFDIVKKTAPFYPSTFTAQDAKFLLSEGMTAVRIGFIWQAVEPQPGVYDDAYIQKFVAFEHLLGSYGIHTLVEFHQDLWSGTALGGQGDGAPAWASLGVSFSDDFQHFWDNDVAADGVGIQTHFIRAWQHVLGYLKADTNIIALEPLNEPQAGTLSGCAPFAQCPQFELTELSAFYTAFIKAIRLVDQRHVILIEGVPNNNLTATSLPPSTDSQSGFTYHQYCQITQGASGNGTQDAACQPLDTQGVTVPANYARQQNGVPTFVGEFSAGDANDDNAYMVDLMNSQFLPWTIWSYFTYAGEAGNTASEGLLLDDTKPGSEANAKQAKLDAIAVPYAPVIAGTPTATTFDRTTGQYTLSYSTTAVPGAHLTSAVTTVYVPVRTYPNGYRIAVTNATYKISGQQLSVTARSSALPVTLTITSR